MTRSVKIVVAAVVWALLGDACAWSQPLPSTPLFKNIVAGRMRLTVMSGQIRNTSGWQQGSSTHSSSDGTSKEQFTFRGTGTGGTIQYERTTPQEVFTMEINSAGAFQFRRVPKGTSDTTAVEFAQAPDEGMSWTVGPEGKQQVCRGPTLWHLLISNPEETRSLVSMLDQFRPQWQVGRMVAAVEAELLKAAGGKRPDREYWAALVEQLADDQFTRREAAERQLRAAGSGILGYLRQLDFDRLDAEQQSRIRRIVKSLSRQSTDDSPEQVVAWLAEDPAVWAALLDRPDESIRRTAARQLTAILGEEIGVDPNADPATQEDAREKLRARIEKSRAVSKKAAKG